MEYFLNFCVKQLLYFKICLCKLKLSGNSTKNQYSFPKKKNYFNKVKRPVVTGQVGRQSGSYPDPLVGKTTSHCTKTTPDSARSTKADRQVLYPAWISSCQDAANRKTRNDVDERTFSDKNIHKSEFINFFCRTEGISSYFVSGAISACPNIQCTNLITQGFPLYFNCSFVHTLDPLRPLLEIKPYKLY